MKTKRAFSEISAMLLAEFTESGGAAVTTTSPLSSSYLANHSLKSENLGVVGQKHEATLQSLNPGRHQTTSGQCISILRTRTPSPASQSAHMTALVLLTQVPACIARPQVQLRQVDPLLASKQ